MITVDEALDGFLAEQDQRLAQALSPRFDVGVVLDLWRAIHEIDGLVDVQR